MAYLRTIVTKLLVPLYICICIVIVSQLWEEGLMFYCLWGISVLGQIHSLVSLCLTSITEQKVYIYMYFFFIATDA